MLNFTLRRLASALPVLLLVTLIIFSLVRLIPGDPATVLAGEGATNQQVQALRAQLHLDEPVLNQLTGYIGGLVHGDLGTSLRTGRPISQELFARLPATIELSVAALLLAIVIGVPAGILSAVRPNRLFDHVSRLVSLIGVSVPVFWLALVLQVIFAIFLNLLPVSGQLDPLLNPKPLTGFLLLDSLLRGDSRLFWSALHHLILPASVLGAFLAATIARLIRAGMLEELRQDYVRTATAKGLREPGVILRHVLPNSLLPAITIIGLKFSELLSGAILTETVFSWPGMGRYMFEAIQSRDYPVIQGATLLYALIFTLGSLLVDLLYSVLDPRIRVNA